MADEPHHRMEPAGCIPSLVGAPLADREGAVLGTVEDLMVATPSRRPVWLLVRLRHAARPYTFVPAGHLGGDAAAVRVPFSEAHVRAAPVRLATACQASREDAVRLCRHYGVRLPVETWTGEVRGIHVTAPPERVAAPALASAS
jgi:PRC-barrel domain protein